MVSSRELQSEVRRKLNRVNKDFSQTVSVFNIDKALTEAYHTWFENVVPYFELNSKIRSDLRQLEVKGFSIIPSKKERWYVAKIPDNCYQIVRRSCVASKEGCKPKVLDVIVERSSKINQILVNPFLEPSYEYEETIADESKDGIHIFYKDFEVSRVDIDYIQKPGIIQTPSLAKDSKYIDADGNIVTKDIGLPLDTTMQSKPIVDIAALILMKDLQEYNEFQTQLNKILALDSIPSVN